MGAPAEIIPELEPVGEVVVVEALPVLAKLAAFFFAIGIIALVAAFCKAFFAAVNSTIGRLPIIGGWLDAPIHHLEQKASNIMATAITGIDGHIGSSLHQLARVGDRLGHDLKTIAITVFGTAAFLEQLVLHPLKGINAILGREHINYKFGKVQAAKVQQVQRAQPKHGEVAARAKPAAHTVVAPRVGDLEILERWTHEQVKGLQAQVGDLAQTVERLGTEVAPVALTGALAVAMGALGSEASRCAKTNRYNKMLCGMPTNLLESLLAGALIVATPISLVEFAKACQKFMGEAEDGLKWFVRELG